MDYRTLETAAEQEVTGELIDFAVSVLHAVVGGRLVMNAVRHPLGFYCLPLLREGGHGVCVHVFDHDAIASWEQPTTSRLHAHSWKLTSFVLHGEIGNVRLQVHDRPDRPTHRIFEVHSGPSGTDEIRPTSRLVRCAFGPTETVGAGGIYTVPAGEFHATVPSNRSTSATLVLGRSVPGLTDLSLGPVHGSAHRTERQKCHVTPTARIALAVLRRMT